MGRLIFLPFLLKQIKSIKYLFRDKNALKRHKAVIILGIAYLISPIDLIPAPILGLSIIDDLVIWSVILNYLKKPLDQYSDQYEADRKRKEMLKGKTVIKDANYTVKNEDEEKQDQ